MLLLQPAGTSVTVVLAMRALCQGQKLQELQEKCLDCNVVTTHSSKCKVGRPHSQLVPFDCSLVIGLSSSFWVGKVMQAFAGIHKIPDGLPVHACGEATS